MYGLSIVIPTFNEEKRLPETLKLLVKYLKKNKISNEIIISDGGSTDRTLELCRSLKIKELHIISSPKREGKGLGVKKGVLSATKELILFMDSDMATPIEEYDKLLKKINEGFDIAIASRNMPESKISPKQTFLRRFVGVGFSILSRTITGLQFKDTQCGFKLFTRSAANTVFPLQTIKGFAFDVELLYISKTKGLTTSEVAVNWMDKRGSTVNPIKESFIMLKDIIRIRINGILGKYN